MSPASTSPPASLISTCTCTAALTLGSSPTPITCRTESPPASIRGGAGYKDIADFKETIMDQSITRVLAFVNIVGAGMTGPPEQDTTDMDPIPCAAAVERYPEHIVGVKSAHFGGPGWESTGGAIEAARRAGSIVMVDFSPKPTRTYPELPGPPTAPATSTPTATPCARPCSTTTTAFSTSSGRPASAA